MHLLLMILIIRAVDSAVELQQKFLMTKPATKTAIIECTFSSDCWNYIHWYQKKDDETLKRVQYVRISNGESKNEAGFEYLKSEKKSEDQFVLKIPNLKAEHTATYYCACWDYSDTVRKHVEVWCKNYEHLQLQTEKLDLTNGLFIPGNNMHF
ncbi:hypothetical protein AMEX_G10768 [Astyanax mexicanus]|uniref:Ig-like domain-containing protein n=1 Tax=Astyanax mexicanus TaxID=7994 RepID=A0A8T2LWP4_ASTMX|nr:hypothetical protein AMEX_G10768 [Astyanax mexicanus]